MERFSQHVIGLATLMFIATNLAIAQVKAPPLPPGSEKVKWHLGQNPKEIMRDKNAHKRPNKDKKRDDRLPQAITPANNAVGKK